MLQVAKEMLAIALKRTVSQITYVPVPSCQENIKVAAPQERAQQRTVEQVVDDPVPRVADEILGITTKRVVQQIASVHVPHVLMEENIDVTSVARQERVQQLTVVQVTDVSLLQAIEEMWDLLD